MFYSLICITYLTPFFIACNLRNSLSTPAFLILYADDTVLMSETPEGSQKTLTAFENYYNNWKLKLNTSQTKVVVFSKRRFRSNFNFNMYGQPIEVQDSYSYLGVTLNYNGNFNSARKKLLDQTQKSLYGLL